ncbi:MAG: hypothetical protein HC887_04820, partial [Desulfobacteraceae bacterium]|nr:hypothetical protein [Desulfobacteraceae bacterium]
MIDFQYNNSFTTHKLLRLMEADGKEAIEKNRPANSGDYYVADDEFGSHTQPNSKKYNGEDSGVYIRNIVVNSDNTIKADIGIVSALNYFTVSTPIDTWYHHDVNKVVTWTTTGIAGATVNIALYRGGTFVSTIASNVPNNGTYTIPLIADTLMSAKDYRIKVISGSVIGISGELTISAANGITVIEPNGGERIRTAEKYMIRWSKGLLSDNAVKIQLMKNGEVRSVISDYTENDGSFEWDVLKDADKTPSTYYIRISSVSNPTAY